MDVILFHLINYLVHCRSEKFLEKNFVFVSVEYESNAD